MGSFTNSVAWIKGKQRPLCDVPWLGNTVILSDGNVNFCCFSSAVVGNVNDHSFGEIWKGEAMRRIRKELAEQRLPKECCSSRCPIYRGDDLNFLVERMDGPNRLKTKEAQDTQTNMRECLVGSRVSVGTDRIVTSESLKLEIVLQSRGPEVVADLFVAIQSPKGHFYFLPMYESFAVPIECNLEISEKQLYFDYQTKGDYFEYPGLYSVCVALFDAGSNPNLIDNCIWSQISYIIVK